MANYLNNCNIPLNTYSCRKFLIDDAIEIFSEKNRKNCSERYVEAGGLITFGNLYDENASMIWNAMTLTEVRIMTCAAPQKPSNIEGAKFTCQ